MDLQELNNFRRSLQFVLEHEGGYVNDPDDPGGETKWGISKRSYPALDIKNLTPEQALEIYQRDYWDALSCGTLDYPTCLVVFDTAVNLGVGRTREWIRNNTDGTEESIRNEILQKRRDHYYNLADNTSWGGKYIKGWMNRWYRLRKEVEINKA